MERNKSRTFNKLVSNKLLFVQFTEKQIVQSILTIRHGRYSFIKLAWAYKEHN